MHHITSYHIIYHITLYHISYHIISYHVISVMYHFTSNHVMSYIISYQASHHIILCIISYIIYHIIKKSKSFPRPMAHRAAPISVSIALGHASANAVRATAGGWSTGSSTCLTSPFLSRFSSARRERE